MVYWQTHYPSDGFNTHYMKSFEARTFSIPKLIGISEKTVEEHLKLYAGYVKNANLVLSMIEMYGKTDDEGGKYSLAEITRRFSFEFGGMRNHEYYFAAFEGGSTPLTAGGPLAKALAAQWGSVDAFLARFKATAMTRGIGWAKLVYDGASKQLIVFWHDEQHLGQLPDTKTVLALDLWEHSYVADYQPSGKGKYVEDFFKNLNWSVIEKNYAEAVR